MTYTVHQLAQLAGISVRTLHYYHQIGLLQPSFIANNGYRYYEESELITLQQILFFKELEFSLEDIQQILGSSDFDNIAALQNQRRFFQRKRNRINKLIKTIDNTIYHMQQNQEISHEELYDAFNDDDMKAYQEEAKKRWGNTEAYAQSMARVGKMTKQEMEKLKADGKAFTQQLADSMDKSIESDDVQALIAQHHKGVNFFYDCDYAMYRQLGQMYVDDPRFTVYYDKFRPGLAVFVRDAIARYCDSHEVTAKSSLSLH